MSSLSSTGEAIVEKRILLETGKSAVSLRQRSIDEHVSRVPAIQNERRKALMQAEVSIDETAGEGGCMRSDVCWRGWQWRAICWERATRFAEEQLQLKCGLERLVKIETRWRFDRAGEGGGWRRAAGAGVLRVFSLKLVEKKAIEQS